MSVITAMTQNVFTETDRHTFGPPKMTKKTHDVCTGGTEMKYATDKIKKNNALFMCETILSMPDTDDLDAIEHDDLYYRDMLNIADDYREYGYDFTLCMA